MFLSFFYKSSCHSLCFFLISSAEISLSYVTIDKWLRATLSVEQMTVIYSDVWKRRCRPSEGEILTASQQRAFISRFMTLTICDADMVVFQTLGRRVGGGVETLVRARLPACNTLPRASEWEAMSRSKSCREICRWAPGLRFYLLRVCLFVSQALPSWGALVHELFGTPIQIILILDMNDYSRLLQMEGGVVKSRFAVCLRLCLSWGEMQCT